MKPTPKRGGWSGGPVKDTGSLTWGLVCLALGAAAVTSMILLTRR